MKLSVAQVSVQLHVAPGSWLVLGKWNSTGNISKALAKLFNLYANNRRRTVQFNVRPHSKPAFDPLMLQNMDGSIKCIRALSDSNGRHSFFRLMNI